MQKKVQPLYSDITGNTVHYITYEYGQGEPGLYLQGGIHGGEVTYFIFHKLHMFLKKFEKEMKKKVFFAPIINPPAWQQRVYYYTVGKFDLSKGKDWNRSYPGKDTTLSARNAKIIYEIAKDYPVLLDLHTARVSKPYAIFTDVSVLPIIKMLGLPYNYFTKPQSDTQSGVPFDEAFMTLQKKALTIECGSHDMYSAEDINTVAEGIKKLIFALGILESNNKIHPQAVTIIKKIDTIFSPLSGFVQYHVSPQQKFSAGDVLCTIYNSSDIQKVETIKAPYDGLAFELARTNITWIGDELLRIINSKDLMKQ